MPRTSLTDRFIASRRPKTRVVYFDTKARGLALRVTPNGVKTWAFVYRAGGKPQWLTLGACGPESTAEQHGESRSRDEMVGAGSLNRRPPGTRRISPHTTNDRSRSRALHAAGTLSTHSTDP